MFDDDDEGRMDLFLWPQQPLKRETERAMGFDTGDQEEYKPGHYRPVLIWLPKSQCKFEETSPGIYDCQIPRWLMEEKELEDQCEEIEE